MIDIGKFEILANKIIENATIEEMTNWFEGYREKQSYFRNFKPITGFFKSNPIDKILVNDSCHIASSDSYSIAA